MRKIGAYIRNLISSPSYSFIMSAGNILRKFSRVCLHLKDWTPPNYPAKRRQRKESFGCPESYPKHGLNFEENYPRKSCMDAGGDRHFFQTNHVHPAQFLSVIGELGDNDQAIIDWVVKQKNSLTSSF